METSQNKSWVREYGKEGPIRKGPRRSDRERRRKDLRTEKTTWAKTGPPLSHRREGWLIKNDERDAVIRKRMQLQPSLGENTWKH